jgi:hypothetical protein
MSTHSKSKKTSSDKSSGRASKPNKKTSKKESVVTNKQGESSKRTKASEHVNLYCAIYTPQFGNYYHWAFAMNHPARRRWKLFQVIQEEENGHFIRDARDVNPNDSSSCQKPLIFLGQMFADYWDWLVEAVPYIPVPGEAQSWNCQDYVVEIWEQLLHHEVIDDESWKYGYQAMLPYYGPDFGSQQGSKYGEEDEDENDDDGDAGEGKILSEEFVLDSDENENDHAG